MTIPADAIIAAEKVRDYLLKPLKVNDKSGYLALAGYRRENSVELLRAIREQLLPCDAVFRRRNSYGDYFLSSGVLKGPNGRNLAVTAIWERNLEGTFKFVTLRPARE